MKRLTINNPRVDNYVAYVYPKQDLLLELNLPHDRMENESWRIATFSDFLIETNQISDSISTAFYFTQRYDLTYWANFSNVQIGEIRLNWIGNIRKGYENIYCHKTILIVLKGKDESVLTVINPIATNAKIQPHQTLEVVLFDPSTPSAVFTCSVGGQFDDDPKPVLPLKMIADKTLTARLDNEQSRYHTVGKPTDLICRSTVGLPFNPNLDPELLQIKGDPIGKFYRAKHFYFQIPQNYVKDLHSLPNKVYQSTEFEFYGVTKDQSYLAGDFCLSTFISVKGKQKQKIRDLSTNKFNNFPVNGCDVEFDADKVSSGFQYKSKEKGVFYNPKDREFVEFVVGGQKQVLIEIVLPEAYHAMAPSTERWDIEVQPVYLHHYSSEPKKYITKLSVEQLSPSWCKSKLMQRFLVKSLEDVLPKYTNLRFLGIVKIFCKAIPTLVRHISFYLINGSRYNHDYTTSQSHYRFPRYTPPVIPEKSFIKISITEIDDIPKETKFAKFSEVKVGENTINKEGKKKGTNVVHMPSSQKYEGWADMM